MVALNNNEELRISIPISGIETLTNYQTGLLGLLRRIEIGNCDPELKEHIKAVYELLTQLRLNEDLLIQHHAVK
jgi:hypothetical protein